MFPTFTGNQGRREGGQGGGIDPGPEVLGGPGNFLLGPSHFCGLNISVQRTRFGLSIEIWYDKLR